MRIILVLIFCFISVLGYTQQKDFGLWAGFSFEKKITKRHSLNFYTQWSFGQNLTKLNSAFLNLGWSYDLNKNFSFSLNYRFIQLRNLGNDYNTVQRFFTDFSYSNNFNKFHFTLRSRYQIQCYGWNAFDSYKNPKNIIRNRITIRYPIDRIYSPYIYFEQFFRLDGFYDTQAIRMGTGLVYRVNKKNSIDIYFLSQVQLNVKRPRTDFVIGLNYNLKQ